MVNSTFHRFADAKTFLAYSLPNLGKREAVNNLILGLIHRNMDKKGASSDFFAAMELSDGRKLFGVRILPNRLILADDGAIQFDPLNEFVHWCLNEGLVLPGVCGPSSLATGFASHWCRLTGFSWAVSIEQKVFELREVKQGPDISGRAIKATLEDVNLAASMFRDFQLSTGMGAGNIDELKIWCQNLVSTGRLLFWEDGEVVSMATAGRETPNGMLVNSIYTLPEKRGKGYASALLAQLCNLVLKSNKDHCSLFTDLENFSSNGLFQRIGFIEKAQFRQVDFHPPAKSAY